MQIIGCLFTVVVLAGGAGQSPLTAEESAPTISYEQAGDYIDQTCFVHGKIVLTSNIGSRCFLNFHQDFRNHFTILINRENYDKFPEPPEVMYRDKNVKVFGRVVEYEGKPEIIVTGPDQITILPDQIADVTEGVPKPGVPKPTSRPVPPPPKPRFGAGEGFRVCPER